MKMYTVDEDLNSGMIMKLKKVNKNHFNRGMIIKLKVVNKNPLQMKMYKAYVTLSQC